MAERTLQVFDSFEAAEEADRAYYASLPPQKRLDVLLELVARHQEAHGEAADRFERVYRVVELPRS